VYKKPAGVCTTEQEKFAISPVNKQGISKFISELLNSLILSLEETCKLDDIFGLTNLCYSNI
jgi:hypothetical protein